MKSTLIEPSAPARAALRRQPLENFARRAMLQRLAALEHGALRLEEGGETLQFGTATARCPLSVTVRVHDPRFYTDLAFGGSIGAGDRTGGPGPCPEWIWIDEKETQKN